jgi:hypothetical protein
MDLVKLLSTLLEAVIRLNSKRLYGGLIGLGVLAYYKPDNWQYLATGLMVFTVGALCFSHEPTAVDISKTPAPTPAP